MEAGEQQEAARTLRARCLQAWPAPPHRDGCFREGKCARQVSSLRPCARVGASLQATSDAVRGSYQWSSGSRRLSNHLPRRSGRELPCRDRGFGLLAGQWVVLGRWCSMWRPVCGGGFGAGHTVERGTRLNSWPPCLQAARAPLRASTWPAASPGRGVLDLVRSRPPPRPRNFPSRDDPRAHQPCPLHPLGGRAIRQGERPFNKPTHHHPNPRSTLQQ